MMEKQTDVLRAALKIKIEELFSSVQSPKVLYFHQDLLSLLNFCMNFKLEELWDKGDKIISFENDTEATDEHKDISNVLFFLNPIPSAMHTISSLILRNQAKSITKQYHLWLVPKIDTLCIDVLEDLQTLSKISIKSFNFGLIPIHLGLTSLELNRHCDEIEVINCAVDGLMKLSKLTGSYRTLIGKGEKARIILQKYEKRVIEQDLNLEPRPNSCLIVLDRKIDLVTPLVMGHSYSALLDHFFGITHNRIMIPGKLLSKNTDSFQPYLLHNKRDPVYKNIAHMCIEQARDYLMKRAEQFKAEMIRRRDEAETVDELDEILKSVGVDYEQIQNHRDIVNFLIEKMGELHFNNLMQLESGLLSNGKADLEEYHYLSLQYPPEHLLRIICLYSQLFPNPNFYSRFEKQLLQIMVNNYSPMYIHSFYHLQKLGLLKNSKAKNKWEQLSELYNLLPEQPHSYTKVHILYSALSVRFVELLLTGKLQPQMSAMLGRDNFLRGLQKDKKMSQIYIFYIGGVTYGQISSLKLLQDQLKIKIHVITTGLTNGYNLMKESVQSLS